MQLLTLFQLYCDNQCTYHAFPEGFFYQQSAKYFSKRLAALCHNRRVLPRNQIHWDKWPTEFEKGGPFQKIWGPSEVPIYDTNGLSAFRQVEKI